MFGFLEIYLQDFLRFCVCSGVVVLVPDKCGSVGCSSCEAHLHVPARLGHASVPFFQSSVRSKAPIMSSSTLSLAQRSAQNPSTPLLRPLEHGLENPVKDF